MIKIIIPTVLAHEKIDTCLSALMKHTDTEYSLELVKNDWRGFAWAVNIGLKHLREEELFEGVLLLNDDVELQPGWFAEIKKILIEDPKVGIIGADHLRDQRIPHVPFWFVYIPRRAVESIGLLDERFVYGEWEDVDYCLRAHLAGYTITTAIGVCLPIKNHSSTISQLSEEQTVERKKNKERFQDKWKNTVWGRL